MRRWRSGGVKYAIHPPANDSLERDISELLLALPKGIED